MARSVAPWVGATDDAMPPPRVRLRIFTAYEGRCQLTGRLITPQDRWALDHKIALCNSGRNVEDNLWPVLAEAHKAKTAVDVAERAYVDKVAKSHAGIAPEPTALAGRAREVVEATRAAKATGKPRLAFRPLYADVTPPRSRQDAIAGPAMLALPAPERRG